MNPFRCSNCSKLLGMIEGKAEIKCNKCKTMNYSEEYYNNVTTNIKKFAEHMRENPDYKIKQTEY